MRNLKRLFANMNYLNLFFAIFGSAMIAFGTAIHVDGEVADGGIIGIARLIEHFTDGKIEIWFSSLLINAFCYLLAWRLMNAKFIVNMGVGALSYSIFIAIFEPLKLNLGDYTLLAALVGMVFISIGTGLMLRYGSAPNGEFVLTSAISKRGDLDFGWYHFTQDFIIMLLFLPVTNTESVIYSLILMTITTPIVDFIVTVPKKGDIKRNVKKKKDKWLLILLTGLVLITLFAIVAIYLGKVYKADTEAIYEYNTENVVDVEMQEFEDGTIAYRPIDESKIKAGFVFYPGGQVEYTSYEPLLKKCAQEGIVCILIKMPQNLAIFGMNKGVNATKLFPEITDWYIGGHSLGGVMAASCASLHKDMFKGVILLGAYSITDISDFEVISIYGSEDGVLNRNKYNDNKNNLPDGCHYEINGGNHAYFGMYNKGKQENDGEAAISRVEQINQAAQLITTFILN